MKLKRLYIKGFKDSEREINLTFSEEPITVIYGVNGSGKTTLLRILHAILSKDERILWRENVDQVKLTYAIEQVEYSLTVTEDSTNYHWDDGWKELSTCNSIFCGIDRAAVKERMKREEFMAIYQNAVALFDSGFGQDILGLGRNSMNSSNFNPNRLNFSFWLEKYFKDAQTMQSSSSPISKHMHLDMLSILEIKNILKNQYRKGIENQLNKISKSFLDTIIEAVGQEEDKTSLGELPENFEKRLQAKKDFVELALASHKDNAVGKKLLKYLETADRSVLNGNHTLRLLMINMLEEAETPNPALESVMKVVEIFNNHLYYQKKLILNADEVYIQVRDEMRHPLSDLSSGERNLLSLLTAFLVIGVNQQSNFYFIDEPELSLNLKWQRKILPLLSELNPNVQIIAASHSPGVASHNSNYLVELK